MNLKSLVAHWSKDNTRSIEDLHRWNVWLAVIYVVQAAAILIVSTAQSYPVTTNFLGVDTFMSQAKGHTVLAAGMHHLFDINLAYAVAAFLLMGAIAHWLAATKLRNRYEKDLKSNVSTIRWIEYAASTSTVLVVIALVSGIYDISSLLMIFGLSATANLLWLASEIHNQKARQTNWLTFAFGCVVGIIPWIVIAIYCLSAHLYGGGVPVFAHWVIISLFVLFAASGANTYAHLRKLGNWTNYLYAERLYMIVSLVAKTALAWQIFAGVLHP